MALPTSGKISHGDIKAEFGGAGAVGLSNYYGVAGGIPTSGTIKESDFYGKSKAGGVFDQSVINYPNDWKNDAGTYIKYQKNYSYKPPFGNTTERWSYTGMSWPYEEQEGKLPDNTDRYWAWEGANLSQYMSVGFQNRYWQFENDNPVPSGDGFGKVMGKQGYGSAPQIQLGGTHEPITFAYTTNKGENGYLQGGHNQLLNKPLGIQVGGANIASDASKIVWHLSGVGGTNNSTLQNGSWNFVGASGANYGRLNIVYGKEAYKPQIINNATISFPVSEGTGQIKYNGYTYSSGYIEPFYAYIKINKVEVV